MSNINREVSLGRCISILYRQSQAHISKKLYPYKIGSGQYPILLALQNNDGAMQERLTNILGIDKANVARAVVKLQKEGYVVRRPDKEDKRIWRIYLTEKGIEVLPIVRNVLREWNSFISLGLSQHEKAILEATLKTMATNAGAEW